MAKVKIYVSSLAFVGQTLEELVEIAGRQKWPLEFSSAVPYSPDAIELFSDYPFAKLAHNYFPAPKIPFVVNLASADAKIRERSISHCLQGLKISAENGASFFAAHAGFCIDPDPKELGKPLTLPKGRIDKDYHWDIFINSVQEILQVAEELAVDFYIENNVIAAFNMLEDGTNPLLCCDAEEMLRLIDEMCHSRLAILLDTAHLKVSAETIGFDAVWQVAQLQHVIKAIHHSDNDGKVDNNQQLREGYWFAEHIRKFLDVPHVLEVRNLTESQIKEQLTLLQSFCTHQDQAL